MVIRDIIRIKFLHQQNYFGMLEKLRAIGYAWIIKGSGISHYCSKKTLEQA